MFGGNKSSYVLKKQHAAKSRIVLNTSKCFKAFVALS